MRHRTLCVVSAGSALLIAACNNEGGDSRRPLPSEPGNALPAAELREGAWVAVSGRAQLTLHTRRGTIVRSLPPFSGTAVLRRGVALATTQSPIDSTSDVGYLPVLAISTSGRLGLGPAGGRRDYITKDSKGNTHQFSVLVGADGGPARTLQYYLNGKLRHTTALAWKPTSGGWLTSSAIYREFRDGRLVGVVAAAADRTRTVSVAPAPPRAASTRAALGILVKLLAPTVAGAQAPFYFRECSAQWNAYIAATGALAVLYDTIANAPEITPAMIASLAAATRVAAAAEMALFVCVDNQNELNNPDNRLPGSGGGGGNGGSSSTPSTPCLDGSGAAHCQSPDHPL
ncbi:MAG TPA: hypothetical protein VEI06_01035 [Gemmatimonadaceae bacterium]|nr:hypothetical protein [Gemmatimonadaceae bacterium]